MTRSEHVEWCKARAKEYLAAGNVTDAYTSMCSDLNKHEETKDHPAIGLGLMMMMGGHLSSVSEMERFIDGFN